MDTPKISVIVPVYKVEAYLDECIRSITGQSYQNLEILLVDDGSPDSCPAMCDAWAEKDSRVRVIHKKNGGLSDARNAGMSAATGELMAFVDSDDTLHPDMFRLLYESMVENDSDLAACGVEMVWEDGTPPRPLTRSGCRVMQTDEAMRAVIEESWLKQPVWYKLYKAELIRNLSFPVGKYHEDVFWTYQAVARAKRVSVFDTVGYYYRQRSGSIMAERYSLKRLDAVEAALERCAWIEEHFPSLTGAAQQQLIGLCMYHCQRILADRSIDLDASHRRWLHRQCFRVGQQWKKEPSLTFKQRLWLNAFLCCPFITCKLRNALKIGL